MLTFIALLVAFMAPPVYPSKRNSNKGKARKVISRYPPLPIQTSATTSNEQTINLVSPPSASPALPYSGHSSSLGTPITIHSSEPTPSRTPASVVSQASTVPLPNNAASSVNSSPLPLHLTAGDFITSFNIDPSIFDGPLELPALPRVPAQINIQKNIRLDTPIPTPEPQPGPSRGRAASPQDMFDEDDAMVQTPIPNSQPVLASCEFMLNSSANMYASHEVEVQNSIQAISAARDRYVQQRQTENANVERIDREIARLQRERNESAERLAVIEEKIRNQDQNLQRYRNCLEVLGQCNTMIKNFFK